MPLDEERGTTTVSRLLHRNPQARLLRRQMLRAQLTALQLMNTSILVARGIASGH